MLGVNSVCVCVCVCCQERAGVKMILIQDASQGPNMDKPLRIIGDPYKVQVPPFTPALRPLTSDPKPIPTREEEPRPSPAGMPR